MIRLIPMKKSADNLIILNDILQGLYCIRIESGAYLEIMGE